MKRWGCRPDLSEVRAAQEKRQKAVSNLLSILFNGEDKKKEDDVSSTLPFGGACVNLFQLYQEVVAAGNHLMDAGCLEEASRLLTAALEVFPCDKVHLYNLACVKSLEGSVEEALKLLLKAKKNGYNNLTHAAVDPDLENLRRSADFAKKFFVEFLGQQHKKNSTTQDESSNPTTTPAGKDNAAENKENNASDEEDDAKSDKTAVSSPSSSGASTTTNGNPDAVALVNMFPNLSFAEAEKTLERFHGDLSAAVNLLLE
jgi:tetratricopeptide (TPR) repeat protein